MQAMTEAHTFAGAQACGRVHTTHPLARPLTLTRPCATWSDTTQATRGFIDRELYLLTVP